MALVAPPTNTSCWVIALPEIAVPFPDNTPVAVVVRVIAGVVVAVATVPAKPFALTTDTEVTVPEVAGLAQDGGDPVVAVKIYLSSHLQARMVRPLCLRLERHYYLP